ncbi:class III extradiol dioxygenase subunit beta [Pseudonocardia sp. NPDC049635]|uniref:class III extradiol dioxygenase subunit beta n=1 Tax=Pseudonocardia sp. NPDC049635 TaxID=3155506 RepID=UPI0033D2A03D
MAEIVAGVGVSHVPALGAAMTGDGSGPAAEVFEKFAPLRAWIEERRLDTVIVVYNDHASSFSLELMPTFVIGAAETYAPADEGYGARDVPVAVGDVDLSWHLIDEVVPAGFDLTIAQRLDVDHGLTVPLTVLFGRPEEWPVRVVPVLVNVVQQPTPSARRCFDLGRALGRAVASFPDARRVGVIGTGGMSHQLQGRRAGHINSDFDRMFLAATVDEPGRLTGLSNLDLIREAGSEGAELVMWLVMRGALPERVTARHTVYHVPVSNTGAGALALEV